MKKAFYCTLFLILIGIFLPNCSCGSWGNLHQEGHLPDGGAFCPTCPQSETNHLYGENPLPDVGLTDFCQHDQVPRESLVTEMTRFCPQNEGSCECYCPNWKGCEDGEVYAILLTRYECGRENIGHLCGPPPTIHRCRKGCRKDCHGDLQPTTRDNYGVYCEENRPKRAGDPCEDESDCLPITSHIEITYQKQLVIHGYLRCDKTLGKCVNTSPPPQKDFMQPCGGALKYEDYKGKRGYFTTSSCQDGVCYAFGLKEDQCVYQGCTRYCKDHHECPQDSLCDAMVNLNQKEGETQGAKICTRMYGNTLTIGAKYMQCIK